MSERLITPAEAQRKMGLPRSTFWDLINAEQVTLVRYTAKCVRVPEAEIDALIEKHTVKGRQGLARLADGRRA